MPPLLLLLLAATRHAQHTLLPRNTRCSAARSCARAATRSPRWRRTSASCRSARRHAGETAWRRWRGLAWAGVGWRAAGDERGCSLQRACASAQQRSETLRAPRRGRARSWQRRSRVAAAAAASGAAHCALCSAGCAARCAPCDGHTALARAPPSTPLPSPAASNLSMLSCSTPCSTASCSTLHAPNRTAPRTQPPPQAGH